MKEGEKYRQQRERQMHCRKKNRASKRDKGREREKERKRGKSHKKRFSSALYSVALILYGLWARGVI